MINTDSSLPVHPVTGEIALGFTSRGPIWPVVGASDDEPGEVGDDAVGDDGGSADGGDDSSDDDGDQSGEAALGDAGKRALDSMKGKYKSEREKRRAAEAELEKARQASKGDGEQPDVDEIRREADKAATQRANTRIVRSEVRAAAAGKLSDPSDALRFIDVEQFEVDENGNVDEDEIADAITDLVKNKPYLSVRGGNRFEGSAEGGARKGTSGPSQLTRDDLQKMNSDEIVKAKSEGRLDSLMGRDK